MKMTRDTRPLSALEQPAFTGDMWLGGLAVAVGAHIGIPLAVFAITTLLASTVAGKRPTTFVEEHVVEAHFVQKGVKKDPNKLPDRVVPRKSTAPDQSTVVSKNMNPTPPEKPKEKPPEKAQEDPLTRIGDRVQDFAEIQEQEREGDENGLEDGTETEAKAGDIYVGQLVAFIRRGWTIPTTIGDTSKLKVKAMFEITRDCKIGATKIVGSSGDPLFDQSIEDRFAELRSLGTTLPEPPPEIAAQYLGQTIGAVFRGDQ
jgi:hypothetical protein